MYINVLIGTSLKVFTNFRSIFIAQHEGQCHGAGSRASELLGVVGNEVAEGAVGGDDLRAGLVVDCGASRGDQHSDEEGPTSPMSPGDAPG
jgi:hypothetical protein